MILALDWAEANDPALAALIRERARRLLWRRTATARPGSRRGDDFLSPALTEALLMRRACSTRGVSRLVRRLPARSRRGRARAACSRPPSSPTARTARSPISTASISAAPGAGAGSPTRSTPTLAALARGRPPTPISTPACRTSPATIWASIGWRPSPCWRSEAERPIRRLRRPLSALGRAIAGIMPAGLQASARCARRPDEERAAADLHAGRRQRGAPELTEEAGRASPRR